MKDARCPKRYSLQELVANSTARLRSCTGPTVWDNGLATLPIRNSMQALAATPELGWRLRMRTVTACGFDFDVLETGVIYQ